MGFPWFDRITQDYFFIVLVLAAESLMSLNLIFSVEPFSVGGAHDSASSVKMFVYAQNAKGSSQPFVLKETLKAPSPSAKSAAAAASNGRGHNKHAGVEGNNI